MSAFNKFYLNLIESLNNEIIVERIKQNRYDRITSAVYKKVIEYIKFIPSEDQLIKNPEINHINLDEITGESIYKYICSINDNVKSFQIVDDSEYNNEEYIRVILDITLNIRNERGRYENVDDRKMFIYLAKEEVEIVRKNPTNKITGDIFRELKNEIFSTIRHEPQHLSEYGNIKRHSIEKELKKKFAKANNYIELYKNVVLNSSECKTALKIVQDLKNVNIITNFESKLETYQYALQDKEISAKCSEIKILSKRTEIPEIRYIQDYIKNQFVTFKRSEDQSKELEKYNNLYKIPEVQEFYKKMELFLINVFVNSIAEFYPSTIKRFDKIELYGSTYNFDKESKTFK